MSCKWWTASSPCSAIRWSRANWTRSCSIASRISGNTPVATTFTRPAVPLLPQAAEDAAEVVGGHVQATHLGMLAEQSLGHRVAQLRVVLVFVDGGNLHAALCRLGLEAAQLFVVVYNAPVADHQGGRARNMGEQLGGNPAAQQRVLAHSKRGRRAGHFQAQLHERDAVFGQQIPHRPVVDPRNGRQNQPRKPLTHQRAHGRGQALPPLHRVEGVETCRHALIGQPIDAARTPASNRPKNEGKWSGCT